MNNYDGLDAALDFTANCQSEAAGGPAADAEEEWWLLAGFSPIERRRLIFQRWLYREGRLTEWAA